MVEALLAFAEGKMLEVHWQVVEHLDLQELCYKRNLIQEQDQGKE